MKDDTSQGRKPQKRPRHGASDANLPPHKDIRKDEEDVDFEILDALEQMEQTEQEYEAGPADGDKTIELTLDDEDMIFGEVSAEEESGFGFDESVFGGGEDILSDETAEFSLDESFGEEVAEELRIDTEQESFSLDLDQENEADELEDQHTARQLDEGTGEFSNVEVPKSSLDEGTGKFSNVDLPLDQEEEIDMASLKTETDLEFEEFNLDAEKNDFSSGLEEEEEDSDMTSPTIQTDNGFGEFNLDLGANGESFDLDLGDEEVDFSQSTSDIGIEETRFLATELEADTGEMGSKDFSGDLTEEEADNLLSEIEIEEEENGMNLDFGKEESRIDTELPEMDVERDVGEFQGKTVISVGDDQVIDLGDETDLARDETFETDLDSWGQDEDIEISGMSVEGLDEGETDLQSDEEKDEDFMTSLEDMEINLEEEATKTLEELGDLSDDSLVDQEPTDIDLVGGLDLTVDEDWEPEDAEGAGFPKEAEEQGISDTYQVDREEQDTEQDLTSVSTTTEAEKEAKEEAEKPVESEIDEREFLGIMLRLSDVEMQDFESMVVEAKTLQKYLDGLEDHKTEIKNIIYQKLQNEYIARKKEIFGSPEFTSIHTNVQYDLQDMLAKRKEFETTVESLKEELEEITVRHLVGEYTDEMLAEKETAQKTEIDHWDEKTEKIEAFITRYQESLGAEQDLNPLRKEPDLEEEALEEPEQESAPEPEVSPEQELVSSMEETLKAEFVLQAEETLKQESVPEPEEETFEQEVVSSIEEDIQEEAESEDAEEVSFGIETEEKLETTEATEEFDEFDTDEDFMGSDFSTGGDFGGEDFEFDDTSEITQDEEDGFAVSYEVEAVEEEKGEQEEMISCKKCGRQTPGSEKFCVHCGAKAR